MHSFPAPALALVERMTAAGVAFPDWLFTGSDESLEAVKRALQRR